jgi:hypothetical protein
MGGKAWRIGLAVSQQASPSFQWERNYHCLPLGPGTQKVLNKCLLESMTTSKITPPRRVRGDGDEAVTAREENCCPIF